MEEDLLRNDTATSGGDTAEQQNNWNFMADLPISSTACIALAVLAFLLVFVVYLIVRNRRCLSITIKTAGRDYRGISGFIKTFRALKKFESQGLLVSDVFEETVKRSPNKVMFSSEGHDWTFLEVWDFSNKVANYFQSEGYRKGDVIALFMENRPEYVGIWLGLSKLGIVTALVNSNLRSHPLAHSIEVADVKGFVFGKELSEAVTDLEATKPGTLTSGAIRLFALGHHKDWTSATSPPILGAYNLDEKLHGTRCTLPLVMHRPKFHDGLLYIYTSGTTGLPKAAIVTTARFMMGSISFHFMNNLLPSDVLYTCLPLYHTAGGLCGVGQAIFYGNTVVLRRRFSATNFWTDCISHQVTVAQYIGELCRYLLSQPSAPNEKLHKIRLMVGNGLRPEIWREFVDRFNIPNISEIYGSTDGNCNFVNFDNRVGAVGFIPVWATGVYPMGLIQVDEVTGEPRRDRNNGLCVRARPNEPGELVGKIVQNHPIRDFQGYAGKDSGESTNKKILRDVFAKGDSFFRTGDFLVRDEFGYFYFKDRAGDTFRWKGENVASAEVEASISKMCGFTDSVVYGVSIPNTDGKAGMACVADPEGRINLAEFAENINKSLAPYARPLFLRICKQIETTSTHKMKKFLLQQEGFDITKIKDPVYFYSQETYVPLNAPLYQQILGGKLKL